MLERGPFFHSNLNFYPFTRLLVRNLSTFFHSNLNFYPFTRLLVRNLSTFFRSNLNFYPFTRLLVRNLSTRVSLWYSTPCRERPDSRGT